MARSRDVFPHLKPTEFENPLNGVDHGYVISDVMSNLPPAMAISHVAAALTDGFPVSGGLSTAKKSRDLCETGALRR